MSPVDDMPNIEEILAEQGLTGLVSPEQYRKLTENTNWQISGYQEEGASIEVEQVCSHGPGKAAANLAERIRARIHRLATDYDCGFVFTNEPKQGDGYERSVIALFQVGESLTDRMLEFLLIADQAVKDELINEQLATTNLAGKITPEQYQRFQGLLPDWTVNSVEGEPDVIEAVLGMTIGSRQAVLEVAIDRLATTSGLLGRLQQYGISAQARSSDGIVLTLDAPVSDAQIEAVVAVGAALKGTHLWLEAK